jgi:hypothetical protein
MCRVQQLLLCWAGMCDVHLVHSIPESIHMQEERCAPQQLQLLKEQQ